MHLSEGEGTIRSLNVIMRPGMERNSVFTMSSSGSPPGLSGHLSEPPSRIPVTDVSEFSGILRRTTQRSYTCFPPKVSDVAVLAELYTSLTITPKLSRNYRGVC